MLNGWRFTGKCRCHGSLLLIESIHDARECREGDTAVEHRLRRTWFRRMKKNIWAYGDCYSSWFNKKGACNLSQTEVNVLKQSEGWRLRNQKQVWEYPCNSILWFWYCHHNCQSSLAYSDSVESNETNLAILSSFSLDTVSQKVVTPIILQVTWLKS